MAIYATEDGTVKNLTDGGSTGLNCAYGEITTSNGSVDIYLNFKPKIICYKAGTAGNLIWFKPDQININDSSYAIRVYDYTSYGYITVYSTSSVNKYIWVFG